MVTLIAVIQLVVSSLSVVSGVLLALMATGALQIFSTDLTQLSLSLKGLIGMGLGISILGLVVTYGLWKRLPWGWLGSLIFQGLCIVNNGLGLLAGQPLSAGVYGSVTLASLLIVALWLPGIRKAIFYSKADTESATPSAAAP